MKYKLQTRMVIGGKYEYHIEDEKGDIYIHPITKIPQFYDKKEDAKIVLKKLNSEN